MPMLAVAACGYTLLHFSPSFHESPGFVFVPSCSSARGCCHAAQIIFSSVCTIAHDRSHFLFIKKLKNVSCEYYHVNA